MIEIMSHWFTHDLVVQILTESIDSTTGENIKTVSTTVNIKGRVRPLSASERYVQNRNNIFVTHRVYSTYSVANFNRIVWGTSTYEVIDIKNPMNMNIYYQADLSLVS